ncbi:MAG: hypothetical protein MUQ10_01855 [Anaerolineae bacterium]|nr:hypothetical protein [Anaerolineae bacterium]
MATTLTTLRDRLEHTLQDAGNAKWTTNQLDEAIRQALAAYSEHLPHRAVTSLLLVAAGRELDISTITYRTIERVWWDYDSAAPDHPPHWRDFETWPGDILYVNDPDQPASGDTVRIWYTADHTLTDLDAATATTLPTRHESILVQGASGFAAAARRITLLEQVNLNEWAPRNLREWAELQLTTFYNAIEEIAARNAALDSGTASAAALDRWDGDNVW